MMEQNQDQTNEVEQEENCPVEENTQDKDNTKKPSKVQRIRSAIFELLVYVAIIVVCVMVVPRYVIQRTIVDGTSMEATLQDQDNLLVDKLSYRFSDPKRFDVIVFYPYGRENEDYYIKRVIGLPGETIQIVGDTIYIDGKDIRELSRKNLRSQYGMVLQETWLKDASVLENILFGREDATREEAIAAAKMSHAHSFIKRLPEGYDTILSENGENLSQGQRQLLSITRVILCKPSILILDEATSSIDTRTEIKIQNAFAKMMEGKTSFIVAHRLSTIQNADIILVMKDGKIIEQGNHEELLEKKGFYSELYMSQFAVD